MNDLEDKRTKPWAMVLFIGVSFLFPLVTSFWTLTNEIDSQAWIPEFSWRHQPALDIWFDSDPPLVYDSMTNTNARWQKTNRHPLFPYLGVIPVKALGLLGVPERSAVCFLLALGVGLSSALFALTLSLTVRRRLLQVLIQALFLCSSSFLFWSGNCERFAMSSASILATTADAAHISARGRASAVLVVVMSVVSLSITLTNWMFGLLLSLFSFPLKRALRLIVYGLLITAGLWLLQGLFINQREHLLHVDKWNQNFVLHPYAGGLLQRATVVFEHMIVMPSVHHYGYSGLLSMDATQLLGVQHSSPGGTGPLGLGLVITWSALFIVGAISWLRRKEKTMFDRFLSLSLLGQLLFHMAYGNELFLYGLHFTPLLLLLLARGASDLKGAQQGAMIGALLIFIPLLGYHNLIQLKEARAKYHVRYEAAVKRSWQIHFEGQQAEDTSPQTSTEAASPK